MRLDSTFERYFPAYWEELHSSDYEETLSAKKGNSVVCCSYVVLY
jgi:hypothetical protein